MAVVLVIAGCIAIVAGILGKDFYQADVVTLAPYKQKSSRWSGRLVFVSAGVFLLAIGIKLLFWPQ